jgi:hypothetical protein
MPLSDEAKVQQLLEYRRGVDDREAAHMLAADQAARAVRGILEHLTEQNYGLAKDAVVQLLEQGLPNDHGGPVTHYPLFEAELAKQLQRRGASA